MTADVSTAIVTLVAITLTAAIVNGALGYGFSSLTVPVALLFYTNRVLNPCILVVELVVNGYVLFVNREFVPRVWKRILPIVAGLSPGAIIGSLLLSRVHPGWLKLATFLMLLPLILLQAAGKRRPIKAERRFGYAFGGGLGVLYALTTVSGPPLALFLNNQGLAKAEFRAALAIIRLSESILTAVAYLSLGLFTADSLRLVPYAAPSVLIGVPVGSYLIGRLSAETFRRLCMSFDAWAVGFGLSTLAVDMQLASHTQALTLLSAIILVDGYLLYRYFSRVRGGDHAPFDYQPREAGGWRAPVSAIGECASEFSEPLEQAPK